MRFKTALSILVFAAVLAAHAQSQRDVLGVHDLSTNPTSPVSGSMSSACEYCHTPHSALNKPGVQYRALWNQKLSQQVYTGTFSGTYNTATQPTLGGPSSLCLSCHDGTVAAGETSAYGTVSTTGVVTSVLGTDLSTQHPFSLVLPIKDAPNLVPSLASQGTTADPAGKVKLIEGNIECTTCHDPHVQSTDPNSPTFLVRDNTNGAICTACHQTAPNAPPHGAAIATSSSTPLATRSAARIAAAGTASAFTAPESTEGKARHSPLEHWREGVHATAQNKIGRGAGVGRYRTIAENACSSCHVSHNGAAGSDGLLRGRQEQSCAACHSGGANISPPAPNVFAEFSKAGHPFSTGNKVHQSGEPTLLQDNRHVTCVDCHDPHASKAVTLLNGDSAIRASQAGIDGISIDGATVVSPAIYQYENCLRCHAGGGGKQRLAIFGYAPVRVAAGADPLNLVLQFGPTAASSHPVTHDRNSSYPQPSLMKFMLNLDGSTPGRAIGVRILCTDCHNSDDNREFGGNGANGPHGSQFAHILERRYEFSRASAPGQAVTNLFPNPDLGAAGPYALCAKCHDLKQVIADTSFAQHSRHINAGFTCSTCHTAHGMGAQSSSMSGERLVNFDINVVAANGAKPIAYDRATSTCSLVCHGHTH